MIYVAVLILLVTLMLGVPVPMSFMASTAWLLFFGGPTGAGYASSLVLPYGFSSMNSIALISIALFIMAGGIMERGRIGEKLIDLVDLFVGRIKGGLGVVGTISCAVFGSITGSACLASGYRPTRRRVDALCACAKPTTSWNVGTLNGSAALEVKPG